MASILTCADVADILDVQRLDVDRGGQHVDPSLWSRVWNGVDHFCFKLISFQVTFSSVANTREKMWSEPSFSLIFQLD